MEEWQATQPQAPQMQQMHQMFQMPSPQMQWPQMQQMPMMYATPTQPQPQYAKQPAQGYRGRGGRGIGRGGRRLRPIVCPLCGEIHEVWYCSKYKTAQQRRERLTALNRCQACTTEMTEATVHTCKPTYCKYHKQPGHVTWTCDGSDQPGP